MRAADEAGAAAAGAVDEGVSGGLQHAGMVGEAEAVVAREVDEGAGDAVDEPFNPQAGQPLRAGAGAAPVARVEGGELVGAEAQKAGGAVDHRAGMLHGATRHKPLSFVRVARSTARFAS